MKIEDQLTSLPLAKKLKHLGLDQYNAFFYHIELYPPDANSILSREWLDNCAWHDKWHDSEAIFAAPTVAELGRLLPYRIQASLNNEVSNFYLDISRAEFFWGVAYKTTNRRPSILYAINDDTQADAYAGMLCKLIEEGILDTSQLKL